MGHSYCAVGADLHVEGTAKRIVYALQDLLIDRLDWIGDRVVKPSKNPLTEARLRAILEGKPASFYEDQLSRDPSYRGILKRDWYDKLNLTKIEHEVFEEAVRRGILPVITDTGGNDYVRYERIRQAYTMLGADKFMVLPETIEGSPAFRLIQGVESITLGLLHQIDIPYIGNKDDSTLRDYRDAISAGINRRLSGVEAIVLRSHIGPEPTYIPEPKGVWYKEELYPAIKEQITKPIMHISAHDHHPRGPFTLDGVANLVIGLDEARNEQVLLVMNYQTLDWELLTLDLANSKPPQKKKLNFSEMMQYA